jgi:RND superfamily putative drug exporter
MLARLARTCYRHRRVVVVSWIVLLVVLITLGRTAGGAFRTDFKLPGSESTRAQDILKANGFGHQTGVQGSIVFRADQGVNDPAVKGAMEGLFAKIQSQPELQAEVVSPYSQEGQRQISDDGKIAYAQLNLADRENSEYQTAADVIKADVAAVNVPGLDIDLGGDIFSDFVVPASEAIGILAAVVILLIAFGSILAMGLPILVALFGIGCGIALVQLYANFASVPDFTTQLAAMIGIGVGIDYALFIVTRYRQNLTEGMTPESATVVAFNTAGRAVLFAGTTVVISLLGMFLLGLDFVRSLAVGAVLAVLMTLLAALTLLPAVLGFVGRKIDKFGLPHRKKVEGEVRQSFWHRWSRVIQRRSWFAFIGGLGILVLLAVPFFSIRLGFSDAGNNARSDTTRRAYDLLSEGFGPGFNGPLILAAETPGGQADVAALQRLSTELNQGAPGNGVKFATKPIPSKNGEAAFMQIVPTTSPQDAATEALVQRLRDDVVPKSVAGTTAVVKVGGFTAAVIDFSSYIAGKLPLFIGAVLALSFLLLMTVFRSLLVPLKAVIMNLLSIGAAYGVIVAIFQWGWGKDLFGVAKAGPFEAWAPMMLFAIVFGLSMDYEVFLLSRIKEEYDRTGDNGLAVADGLAATARVITAAAAIMICVFASFVLGDNRAIKLFGLGLAVAVLIDATVVRLLLVPATMELLGDRNWWLPKWLDKLLPRVHVEGRDIAPVEEPKERELVGAGNPD